MDIILKVLEELHFYVRDEFGVECSIDAQKNISTNVRFLISDQNDSQVFLVIECDDIQLVDYADGKVIKEIAVKFRKNNLHRAEMDRNTTLLIACKHAIDSVDYSSKVKIEDDPYYFKKYVFSYDEIGLENANNWLKENDQKESIVSLIQGYITDTEHFARYKENFRNEVVYAFFMELVTKLHCFPMKTAETKSIKKVRGYLQDEIETLKRRSKNPIYIDLDKMDFFIESNVNYDDATDVCNIWNSLQMERSE